MAGKAGAACEASEGVAMAEVTRLYMPSEAVRKKLEQMSVLILTPCKDYEVPISFSRSVTNMVAYSWLNGLKIYQHGTVERMVVHWARNELARLAQEHICGHTGKRYTHVLWLDDDHVFNPDLALCLARHDVDMVSALYFGRVGRHLPVAYVKDETPNKYMHYQILEVPPKLCEVDAVGFGACLMRMDVLDRIPAPWFKFGDAGEDVHFCVNAKEHGIKVHVDGSYMVGHIGESTVVTQDTYKRFLDDKSEEYADRIAVPLGGQNAADSVGIGNPD